MRARVSDAKPAKSPWDIKLAVGGLTEIDFILQSLELTASASVGRPPRGEAAIAFYQKNAFLSPDEAATLQRAYKLYGAVLQVGRAATGGAFCRTKPAPR